ncbi:MAG: hypothetical protein QF829_01375 [Candidatus Hydrothermarchaeota archaeon]|nr:hypothetical protein [Candidatus Hydrothermarchaeota archaeon]
MKGSFPRKPPVIFALYLQPPSAFVDRLAAHALEFAELRDVALGLSPFLKLAPEEEEHPS